MSNPPNELIWEAPPHTLAKVCLLRKYLVVWFSIIGRSFPQQDIWYIDGFSGPGEYTNYPSGSPLAALEAAETARKEVADAWRAGDIKFVFIEADAPRLHYLEAKLANKFPAFSKRFFAGTFAEEMVKLRQEPNNPFFSHAPLFTFIDPFGAMGVPFSVVADLLEVGTSEVLINLDSDGIGRIFWAGHSANSMQNLTEIFGDYSWETALKRGTSAEELYRSVLKLYKQKLKAIPQVKYVFAFEMRSSKDQLNYHLVFASKHPKGLEIMKEQMKTISQNGEYTFSDAKIDQPALFRFDDPDYHSHDLYQRFKGVTASYQELTDYALNESPFLNPKKMLFALERQELIQVVSSNPRRRKGTFSDEHTQAITFL